MIPELGRPLYPGASRLLIAADGGGSNGSRVRLWKLELQKLSDELGLIIDVCHLPPGTSKWNTIESLIAATTNNKGLKVHRALDTNVYRRE